MKKYVEYIIFGSKWLLIPFYLGLIVVMIIYTWIYSKEILHLVVNVNQLNKESVMLVVLEIVDIVMIANLVKMIITGSYTSFVCRDKSHSDESERASSGMLKVKMSTSLIGVSSIHLLQTFINSENTNPDQLHKQLMIHGIFIVGALVLSVIDYLHLKSQSNGEH